MESGEWRVESEEWRVERSMGDVCGHCGVGVAGGCSCGPDSPQGCPAIRPLQMGEYLRPSRDRADRQCACGLQIRGRPRPFRNRGGGAMPTGRRGRHPLRWSLCPLQIRKVSGGKDALAGGACPAPTNGGIFAAVAGQGQPRNVPAGRIYPAPTVGGIFAAVAGQSGQAMCLRATD